MYANYHVKGLKYPLYHTKPYSDIYDEVIIEIPDDWTVTRTII